MRFALLALCLLQVGCNILTGEQRQAEIDRKADEDRALRRQHMLATGAVRESEYETVNRHTGAPSTTGALPPPPTTEELEQRVKVGTR